jgi:hypothetical protein
MRAREDLRECNLSNRLFIRLVAKDRLFENINFQYTIFEGCYLRECKFVKCDFTGCKFVSTNLSGTAFSGCKFEYALFEKTLIANEILDTHCPPVENLTMKFARTLRMNFQQIGDAEGVNKAIHVELQATETHLRKAWRSREGYYREKYSGLARVTMFIKWVRFRSLDLLCGNGESVARVASCACVLVLCIVSSNLVLKLSGYPQFRSVPTVFEAFPIFLGIYSPPMYSHSVLAWIALSRYLILALLTSTLVKRLNRR